MTDENNVRNLFVEFTDEKQLSYYGTIVVQISKDQLLGLIDGKKYVFTDEYSFVVELDEDERSLKNEKERNF